MILQEHNSFGYLKSVMVFSAMQVKAEICAGDNLCNDQLVNSVPSLSSHNNQFSLQDMTCFSNGMDKSSPYSLWAEYFDNFPVLTEFDLRSTVNCAGSTGSSIASSASTSCESWSSPGSGSPFSDCDTDESPFDDNSVPNSVIDEIVQTLKMDGYNFDHLGEDIIDIASNHIAIKQEPELTNQACILQSPVYTSLHPPKLQQMETRKYNSPNLNDNISSINDNPLQSNLYDSSSDGKWCHQANLNNHNSNNNNIPGGLPSMSLQLPQIQQHNPHIQQQQHHHQVNHLQQPDMTHTHHQNHPQVHHLQQMNYTNSILDGCNSSSQYTNAVFPDSFSLHSPPIIDTYKYLSCKSPVMPAPPQLVQACEKQIESKPRRRRSTNNINKVEKPHVCKECGAAFKLSANLKQHQVIHTGEKPFSCEICKAMFTRLSSLKTHHRLHTGEKPHICPFCSAAFADRSAMKAHKRIHTGERPYKCQVCSTSFTQLSHLNAHKRTHTGEKPYACSVCSTTFKQLGHLKRHEKSHVCSGRC